MKEEPQYIIRTSQAAFEFATTCTGYGESSHNGVEETKGSDEGVGVSPKEINSLPEKKYGVDYSKFDSICKEIADEENKGKEPERPIPTLGNIMGTEPVAPIPDEPGKSVADYINSPAVMGCAHDRSVERMLYNRTTREKLDAAKSFRLEGNKYFQDKNYNVAEINYQKALLYYDYTFPDNPEDESEYQSDKISCHLNMAATKHNLKAYRDCINQCRQALKMDPDNVKAHFRTGQAHFTLDEFPEASEAFNRVLKQVPAHAEAQAALRALKIKEKGHHKKLSRLEKKMGTSIGSEEDKNIKCESSVEKLAGCDDGQHVSSDHLLENTSSPRDTKKEEPMIHDLSESLQLPAAHGSRLPSLSGKSNHDDEVGSVIDPIAAASVIAEVGSDATHNLEDSIMQDDDYDDHASNSNNSSGYSNKCDIDNSSNNNLFSEAASDPGDHSGTIDNRKEQNLFLSGLPETTATKYSHENLPSSLLNLQPVSLANTGMYKLDPVPTSSSDPKFIKENKTSKSSLRTDRDKKRIAFEKSFNQLVSGLLIGYCLAVSVGLVSVVITMWRVRIGINNGMRIDELMLTFTALSFGVCLIVSAVTFAGIKYGPRNQRGISHVSDDQKKIN